MYSRITRHPEGKSFFLFGPRGTGKSTWVRSAFPDALYIDLLASEKFTTLTANPQRLNDLIPPGFAGWIVLDEIQKIPALLDEVHRLIENRGLKFVLTGSSARKLRRRGVNLLAGRALTLEMHPLTANELGKDFSLERSWRYGHLPAVFSEPDPAAFLKSYVQTYMREEVIQEGLTRNIGGFARFLETASFSQGSVLNISDVARECAVERKVVEGYFQILEDILLAGRLPVFSRKAKRRLVAHPKFYFFDAGVFRAIRPRGPLDLPEEIDGAALETLVYQELRAINAALGLGYTIYYWRTATGGEVDFVLYGEAGLLAFEVKRSSQPRKQDSQGIKAFLHDYPQATGYILYRGRDRLFDGNITWLPVEDALKNLPAILRNAKDSEEDRA
jgi:predicted AAA+ superfamily ATPase